MHTINGFAGAIRRGRKAESILKEELELEQVTYGQNHPRVAWILDALSLVKAWASEWESAMEFSARSIALRENLYGEDHPLVAFALMQAIGRHRMAGKPKEAQDLVERALRIFETRIGPDSPPVASALRWLARFKRDQGDMETARSMALRALEIERRIGTDALAAYREASYAIWFGERDEAVRLLRHARSLGLPESFILREEFRSLSEAPGFLDLLEPEKRERFAIRGTMANLTAYRAVLNALFIDEERYPDANSIQQLKEIVEPIYIREAPLNDGWARPFLVESTASGYTICSGGRDGGDCTLIGDGGPSTNPDDAIILRNGDFVQWPEGFDPQGN
jgi:tetratricopeptide (TPR) repeat protein